MPGITVYLYTSRLCQHALPPSPISNVEIENINLAGQPIFNQCIVVKTVKKVRVFQYPNLVLTQNYRLLKCNRLKKTLLELRIALHVSKMYRGTDNILFALFSA